MNKLIDQIKRFTGTELDKNDNEYCEVYDDEWNKIISIIRGHKGFNMQEIEKIKLELETYKDGMVGVYDAAEKIRAIAFNYSIPALDLLQARLEAECKIEYQDDMWCLFEKDGEYVTGGDTVREMIFNLIFIDG